jgi:hypothetical protein
MKAATAVKMQVAVPPSQLPALLFPLPHISSNTEQMLLVIRDERMHMNSILKGQNCISKKHKFYFHHNNISIFYNL